VNIFVLSQFSQNWNEKLYFHAFYILVVSMPIKGTCKHCENVLNKILNREPKAGVIIIIIIIIRLYYRTQFFVAPLRIIPGVVALLFTLFEVSIQFLFIRLPHQISVSFPNFPKVPPK
jgi:hypothetical protein